MYGQHKFFSIFSDAFSVHNVLEFLAICDREPQHTDLKWSFQIFGL